MLPVSKKYSYFNDKQVEFLQGQQMYKVMQGGRGAGKTTTMSHTCYDAVKRMPGSRTFFASSTYGQILSKTLPAIEKKWQEWGLRRGYHYVVGKRPPRHFRKPVVPVYSYKNVISFNVGSYIEFMSMDRADLQRGGSYDGGNIDEACLVKEKDFHNVLMPSIRDNEVRWRQAVGNLLHRVCFFTSMPRKAAGRWILKYADKAIAQPEKFMYLETTALDNIKVLGQAWIDNQRSILTYLAFQTEIMNVLLDDIPDQFYNTYDSDIHLYEDEYIYNDTSKGIHAKTVKKVRSNDLLELSVDFGGWFSCGTIWQEHQGIERCIDAIYVKPPKTIFDLMDLFISKYAGHRKKYVRIWGEPRGHDARADSSATMYERMAKYLEARGWDVEIKAHSGRTTSHEARQQLMSEVFAERTYGLPKIRLHAERCSDVDIAIKRTGITPDFKKDKRNEKDREYAQEHAPHFTDTIDYYIERKHGWKILSTTPDYSGIKLVG